MQQPQMADEEEESWQEFFDNNRTILPHPSRRIIDGQKQAITGFCLTIKAVEGVRLPQALTNEIAPNDAEFQLRITFFDTANKYFYGSTWLGPILSAASFDNGRFTIDSEEPLYFHSSLNDYTCVTAAEIIVFGKNNQGYSLGWTFLRIFDRVNELRDISTPPLIQRHSIYRGSLGLLHYLPPQDDLEGYLDNQKIEGCYICYSLQIHPALEKVFHLFPENLLLGGDDIVPGISETKSEDDEVINILRKPRLLKTYPCFINKLSVHFEPSIEDFEEQMLDKLNLDRLHKSNISPDDGLRVSVVERRLRVGVHNGWTYVSEPHVVYLEPEYEGGGSKSGRRSPSPSQGSLKSAASKIICLVLRSRLELVELVQHHLCAVVFEVEYVISEPFAQPLIETKKKKPSLSGSLMRSNKHTVTVKFGVWTPFEENRIAEEKEISLDLEDGAKVYPGMKMVYKANKNKIPGKIKFMFTQQRRKGSSMRSSIHGSQTLSIPQLMKAASSLGSGQLVSTPYSSIADIPGNLDPNVNLSPGIMGRPPLPERTRASDDSINRDFNTQGFPRAHGTAPAPAPVSNLTEVPYSPYHTPLLLSNVAGMSSGTSTLTRAAFAQLSSTGYTSITDRHGNPPMVIDPGEVVPLNIEHEVSDSLQANEIVIQFLALSSCFGHQSVFFTFQFYRFPQVTTERLFLKGSEKQDQQGLLCILQKLSKDGSISNEAPGLVLKYLVDPAFMQEGERKVFSRYLLAQNIHIDVWDGDSLLLIGSVSLELKHLLRQGREAVLVSHEVDIVSVEYSEDSPAMTGDVNRTGTVRPIGIKSSIKGRLHLRIANIGHHSEMPTARLGTVPKKRSHVVMSETITGSFNGMGSTVGRKDRCKAKLLAECDAELASVLFSRQGKVNKDDKSINQDDAIRQRKLQRMQAVRQTTGVSDNLPLIIKKEEKLQRARDLKTIQLYRDKNKHEGIVSLLSATITTTYTIYPSFGTAEFFEFAIRNPYDIEQTIAIQCDDKELMVITDTREWRHFKKFTETYSTMEENMFNTADTTFPEVFLRPRESVHIPFKFQTFKADHSVPQQGPSHPFKQQITTFKTFATVEDNKLQPHTVKVSFVMKDSRPIAILNLNIEPRPHIIDQTFRFYHPEQSFLKKSIRLPPWHSLPGAPVLDDQAPPQVHVRCSDVNAVCEARRVKPTEPQDVFLKIACGPSPSVKRFFVLLYIDLFFATPCQTWQFYVHSLQRVDMSAVEGQTSRLSVILRGTQTSRLVRCYSSHPAELQVSPMDPIMLMANTVREVTLSLTPLSSGSTRFMYVNVVDSEFHQLVRTWLVCASCQQPVISKAFELQLQVGGGKGSNKRVSFTNPYPTRNTFNLRCNRPDILQFKENVIEVGPGESHHIGLRFAPQSTIGNQQVLIFINDSEGKNEETFSISAIYK